MSKALRARRIIIGSFLDKQVGKHPHKDAFRSSLQDIRWTWSEVKVRSHRVLQLANANVEIRKCCGSWFGQLSNSPW